MNEKIKAFLDEKKYAEKEKYEKEKKNTLLDLGLFEKEYAPIIGYGHIENDEEIIKFSIKNDNIKVGDTVKIVKNDEKIDVIIDKIQSEYSEEYPFSEWDYDKSINKYYKKICLDATDEEYEEIKKYSKKENSTQKNYIATALTVIAWIVFIGGFIAGIAFGKVEVVKGIYYTYTDTEFSLSLAFTYWCISFISGTMFLGFAEIIKLLEDIKNK